MSAHDCFKAYKMTLLNRHKFWNVSIVYIKIGKFPVVCNRIKLKTAIYDSYGKYKIKCVLFNDLLVTNSE